MRHSSGIRGWIGVLVLGFAMLPHLASAQATLDTQLLLNPGAEDETDIAPGEGPVIDIPNWDTMGTNFSVEGYDPSADVQPSESARINGGLGFFSGGPSNAASEAVQTVDVSALASTIDTGTVNAIMDAQMSGCGGQGDNGTITVNFLDANQKDLGSPLTLGPQAGVDNNLWIEHRESGPVPKGTRSIVVTMSAKRQDGNYNDAYFDNLSLVLTQKLPLPPPLGRPTAQNKELLTNGDAESGTGSTTGNELETIPGWMTTGKFTVITYDSPDGPASGTSDSIGGGKNLFVGGPGGADSSATQTVDVSVNAGDIDAGKLRVHFVIDLGSTGTDSNTAEAHVDELDVHGNVLFTLDADTAVATGGSMGKRNREAPIFPGTRALRVVLNATGGEGGYNGAFFDNASLTLKAAMPFPAPAAAPNGPAAAKYAANLLVDPGAEDAMCDPNTDHTMVAIPGWTITTTFNATYYNPSFGDVDGTEQDHINGGNCYFTGGYGPYAAATQTVDVTNFAADIDARLVQATIDAWMAGYQDQGDAGQIVVRYLDSKLNPIPGSTPLNLGPVHGTDPVTSIYSEYKDSGSLPAGTRNLQVAMITYRTDGSFDDAYMDNLDLSLARLSAPPAVRGDLNGDGKVTIADAVLALQISVGNVTPTAAQLAAGDLAGGGKITVGDVVKILQFAVGILTSL